MKPVDLRLVEINNDNLEIYKNLAQAYEAEFLKLTQRMPNEHGLFKIDILPFAPYTGYFLYCQEVPVGFCVANVQCENKDIAEFYIVPVMRKKNLGCQLAYMMFNKYSGQWQVRQIDGADHAIDFWCSVIGRYTRNQFEESVVTDEHWGVVTRQRFLNLHEKNNAHDQP